MYIKRDLAPVRLLTFMNNRRIWSLFKKAWDKDATGYLNRCYYYKNGAVVNTTNFNRFIRAIGLKKSDLTDIDYDGIESAWFEINLPTKPKVTVSDIQNKIDALVDTVEHTVYFNAGYVSGSLSQYTDANGVIDTELALNNILSNIEKNIMDDNITFYNSDILEGHLLADGSGFDLVSKNAYTLVDRKRSGVLLKCSVTYRKNGSGTATQRTADLINGDLVLTGETQPISFYSHSFMDFTAFDRSSNYIWTFSEFDSLKKSEFINLFKNNFDTDYEEEEAEWYEIIIAIIVIIIAVVLAIPSGGVSITSSLAVFGTFIASITLYISVALFVVLRTVGMGAIGLIRIFGKVVEILGIASSILGVYAVIQNLTSEVIKRGLEFWTSNALKVFNTYNKFFASGDEEAGAKDTTKENQDMINHRNEFIFTKSFETTEIEEHYQLMFDIDRFIHV